MTVVRAVLGTDALRSPPANPTSDGDEADGPRPPSSAWPLATAALAGLAYALVALLAYRPILPGDGSRLPTCACGDLVQGVWFLRWTPFALLHGMNPFLTNYIDYRSGVNLAQNTLMPLLGVLAAPITWVAGPVASLNTLLWLAFPLSATAGFVAFRHWIRWTPAAFVAGLLYGFSPYTVGQGVGHLNLVFVPFPPLILMVADELFVRQRRNPLRFGALLGLLLAAQFLVSPEIFASTLLLAAFGLVILGVSSPGRFLARLPFALRGVWMAAAVCALLIGYPVYLEVAGPGLIHGSNHGSFPYAADGLGMVIPDRHQWLAPAAWMAIGDRFIHRDSVENGSYLGIPLLALLIVAVVWLRREAIVRWAVVMAAAAAVLALGPTLTVDTRTTSVKLPMALLDHLPLAINFIDARFALYVDLLAALVLGLWLDRMHTRWQHRPEHRAAGKAGLPATALLVSVVTLVALVPLVPRWPYRSFPTVVPSFFQTAAVDRIPPGSVALTYPFPQYPNLEGMLWQAEASMRFRVLGGYALRPGVDQAATPDPLSNYLPSVPATLVAAYLGTRPADVIPGTSVATPLQIRAYLRHYQVATVMAEPVGARSSSIIRLIGAAIGSPPTRIDGIDTWFDVPGILKVGPPAHRSAVQTRATRHVVGPGKDRRITGSSFR